MNFNKAVGTVGALLAGSILTLGALVATTAILAVTNPGSGDGKSDVKDDKDPEDGREDGCRSED